MTAPKMAGQSALTKKQLYERLRGTMESERSSFISLWRSINDYILPTRGRFFNTDFNRGDRRSKSIMDITGSLAARTLASGMMSGITSPARPWFRLTTPDPDLAEQGAVKEWLFTVTERMRSVLARSNFYNKAPVVYQDLGVFGTAGLMELEDDHKVVRFVDFPIGSFCIANDENDEPNILTRSFQMTVRQLVKRFGYDRCSLAVRRSWDNGNPEVWIPVTHIIEPNGDYDANSLYSHENKAFYSCYYEQGSPIGGGPTPELLRESGFSEFPAMFPVWEVTGEDVYGTNCPGIMALSDVKQLQTAEKRGLQGLDKMVNPPMTGPTSLKSVRVSILPADVTYVDTREGQQGFRAAHEVALRLDQLEGKQGQVRDRINRAFFADLFLMLAYMDDTRRGSQPPTAAEIYERHEEKLLALGPVLEQLNQRALDPIIDRTFNIMDRRGFIPPPPPDIQGVKLKVEYISIMHQAQKQQALGGLRSVVDFILPLAEHDPSVLDKYDLDKIGEHVAEAAGTPPDIIRPQEKVDSMRSARAQAAQEQRQAESIKTQAEAAKKLSETNTDQPSALKDLMSSGGLPTSGAGLPAGGAGAGL